MTRTLIVIAAFLTLSVPAALAVPPADKGKPEKPGKSQSAPGQSAEKNAAKACKAERGTTAETHRRVQGAVRHERQQGERLRQVRLGEGEEGRGSRRPRTQEEAEENAAKKCKAERGTTAQSIEAFKEKYGTNTEQGERLRQVRLEAREARRRRELTHTGSATGRRHRLRR